MTVSVLGPIAVRGEGRMYPCKGCDQPADLWSLNGEPDDYLHEGFWVSDDPFAYRPLCRPCYDAHHSLSHAEQVERYRIATAFEMAMHGYPTWLVDLTIKAGGWEREDQED